LEIALKLYIFPAVRNNIISLFLILCTATGLSGAKERDKLPDGLRYRQIRKIVSKDARPLFKSAEKYFNKGKYPLADQSYLGAIKQKEEFYGNWGRACIARQNKEYLSAGKLYTAAFGLNDSLTDFLRDYTGFLQQNSRDWNWIAKVAEKFYAATKTDEALEMLLATSARLDKRLAFMQSLQRLIQRYPREANVRVYYASLLYEEGQKEEAVAVTRQAIAVAKEPFHLKLLVLILAQEGYFIDGARACEKLSRLAPNSAQTLEAWGFLEYQQGHYENAATHYRKALNRDYRLATLLTLARLYTFYLNDPDQAIYYGKAILHLDRQNCDALYLMAEVKRRQGNLTTALKYSARQMELQPDHPQTYYYHGKLFFQNKDYANAIKYLELAVRYNPDIKRYRLVLAKAYAGAGLKEKARETYTNYLNEPLKDLWQEENMLKETPPQPR